MLTPYDLARLAVTGYGPIAPAHHREGAIESLLFGVLSFGVVGPLISALHVHALVAIGKGKRPRLGCVAKNGLRV
ncbi:MAG: hypothetical protein ACYDA6_04145, partial [Solirubrobacteraceae bacterium]